MGHYIFFALEITFAIVVITWGVRKLRRMKRSPVETDSTD